MNFTWIVQTRARPHLLLDTIKTSLPNMVRPDSRLMLQVDDDDALTLHHLSKLPTDKRIVVSVKPREDSRGEKYDRALTECPSDLYLLGVDHGALRTPGFDQMMIDAAQIYPDGIGCVYTPMINESFPGLQAITARLAEKIGYLYSHEYPFWFIDHELDDIARMIGRFTFVAVHLDCGSKPGKSIRLRDLEFWTLYFDVATIYRRELARKIIMDPEFQCPEWQKKMMLMWFQVTEARSFNINNCVRAHAETVERARGEPRLPPDAGYVRIKDKAEAILAGRVAELQKQAA